MVVGIVFIFFPMTIYCLNLLGWLLLLFGVFGHVTAFQRFGYVWLKLE
jgi:archaetidylinositol phosphate synthase